MNSIPWYVTAFLPVVTLVIGYLGTLFTESRRDARVSKREAASRLEDRRIAKADAREQFELEQLHLAYQGMTSATMTGIMLHAAIVQAAQSKGANYSSALLSDNAKRDEWFAAMFTAATSVDLILDDVVRDRATVALRSLEAAFNISGPIPDMQVRWIGIAKEIEVAEATIAERVRDLYGKPVPQ